MFNDNNIWITLVQFFTISEIFYPIFYDFEVSIFIIFNN